MEVLYRMCNTFFFYRSLLKIYQIWYEKRIIMALDV